MPSRKVDLRKKNANVIKLKKIKTKAQPKAKGRIPVDVLLVMSSSTPAPGSLPHIKNGNKTRGETVGLPPLGSLARSQTVTVLSNKLHQGHVDISPRKRAISDDNLGNDLDSGQNSQRSLVLSSRNLDGWDVTSAASLGSVGSLGTMGSASTTRMPASSKKVYTVHETPDIMGPPVERTVREMVLDIEKRAKSHKPRPVYLPTMDELPSNVTSWNGNNLDTLGTATSNIDIMPCHQSLELVLVLADERARKRTALLEQKAKLADEKRKKLETNIYEKFHRVQLYQQDMCKKNIQATWARIIFIADYAEKYAEKYRKLLKSKRTFFHEFRAAMILKKQIMKWKDRVVAGRYNMYVSVDVAAVHECVHGGVANVVRVCYGICRFFKMMSGKNWRMSMQVRILHKRLSIRRITLFLTLCKGQKQVRWQLLLM
jgi:hypothetical protein